MSRGRPARYPAGHPLASEYMKQKGRKVEAITGEKKGVGRHILYRVHWKGFSSEDDTWETKTTLANNVVWQQYMSSKQDADDEQKSAVKDEEEEESQDAELDDDSESESEHRSVLGIRPSVFAAPPVSIPVGLSVLSFDGTGQLVWVDARAVVEAAADSKNKRKHN